MTKEEKEELEKCKKGRKVQVLILLDKNDKLTASEICELAGIDRTNLTTVTKRLHSNGLIDIYNESRFKDPSEANYKYKYHSLTEKGRELIADLGR